jgi:hypothetical protein
LAVAIDEGYFSPLPRMPVRGMRPLSTIPGAGLAVV